MREEGNHERNRDCREKACRPGLYIGGLGSASPVGVIDPLFIPPLSRVAAALRDLAINGELGTNTLVSLRRAVLGLMAGVVFGLPLGFLLGGWFPRLQTALEPLMELFAQANPLVLFHVIMLFLGIGEAAKTFIIGWLCLWPVTFSTITGVRTVDPLLLKAARSRARPRESFRPGYFPCRGAVNPDGGQAGGRLRLHHADCRRDDGVDSGLGWLVIQPQEAYNVTRIFAGAAVITGLAVGADWLLKRLGRRFLGASGPGRTTTCG